MSLIWRQEMSTGLEWQDEQHQQIFEQIDKLLEAMRHSAGQSVVKDLIDFLGNYTRTHFEGEEDYMLKHNCTTYAEHKKCHEDFSEQLGELVELYNRQGASTMVVMRLQSWLRDWLINHIMNVDRKMLSACSL
jgi:hemerythrin